MTARPDAASWLRTPRVLAETSTLETGSNPTISFTIGERLRPATSEDIRNAQALQM